MKRPNKYDDKYIRGYSHSPSYDYQAYADDLEKYVDSLEIQNITKININYNGENVILVYDKKGVLEYVINAETNKKMMLEYTQIGTGYEISKNNGYVSMDVCNAVYLRIMGLDVFVPKFILIPNNK